MRRPMIAATSALLLVLACAGCGTGEQARTHSRVSESAPAAGETTVTPTLQSRLVKLTGFVEAPSLAFDEFRLPPRCILEDYNEYLALVEQPTEVAYPATSYLVLDLSSGQNRRLDWPIVNADKGWERVTVRIGDGWLAWEEVSPNEGIDMYDAEWRLYAASCDFGTGAVGEPIEIDGGHTNYRLRPQFVLLGDEIVWTRNRVTMSLQETSEFSGRLLSRRLPDGEERQEYSSADVIFAFRVSPGGFVMTLASEFEGVPPRLVVVDPVSGSEIDSCTLDPRTRTSHWGDYRDGNLSWAWFPDADAQWPSLALKRADGTLWCVDAAAGDGNMIGGYLLYERNRDATGRGSADSVREICAVDLDTLERFVLCDSSESSWESCVSGSPGSTYLISRDDTSDQDGGAATVVRRYRFE